MMRQQTGRCATLRAGFSLLEVLVALVIFAIGISGMLVTLAHHMRDISFTEDHARAVRIATREMNRLRRARYLPEAETAGEDGRYTWEAVVEEVEEELPGIPDSERGKTRALKPYEMSIVVRWGDVVGGEQNRKVELRGLELFPGR